MPYQYQSLNYDASRMVVGRARDNVMSFYRFLARLLTSSLTDTKYGGGPGPFFSLYFYLRIWLHLDSWLIKRKDLRTHGAPYLRDVFFSFPALVQFPFHKVEIIHPSKSGMYTMRLLFVWTLFVWQRLGPLLITYKLRTYTLLAYCTSHDQGHVTCLWLWHLSGY